MSSSLTFGDLWLEGRSRAGRATWFRVHPPGLAFDVGRGASQLAGARDLFLSHAHLDHALGVPFVLSERTLHQSQASRVFCPRPAAEALAALIAAAEAMEQVEYRYRLIPVEPGDRIEVGKGMVVEAFATRHVVPSLGYLLWRSRHRLAERYRDLDAEEIIALRDRGEEVTEAVEELALAYCGDTAAAVFEDEPRLYQARILLSECTYFSADHEARSRRYQHIHLDDLAERADRFDNEALVLHHLSRRHTQAELIAEARRRLPALADRLHFIGESAGSATATGEEATT